MWASLNMKSLEPRGDRRSSDAVIFPSLPEEASNERGRRRGFEEPGRAAVLCLGQTRLRGESTGL